MGISRQALTSFSGRSSARRVVPLAIAGAAITLATGLLAWDADPQGFPSGAHAALGAAPLALIACALVAAEVARGARRAELFKAVMLAAAFGAWSANQLWPTIPQATALNDLAIALFVLDVFLVILGWPAQGGAVDPDH
jgi:hypothetical protein